MLFIAVACGAAQKTGDFAKEVAEEVSEEFEIVAKCGDFIYAPPDEQIIEPADEPINEFVANRDDLEKIQTWLAAREGTTFYGPNLFDTRRRTTLTAEEAAYDINIFFTLLRHIYAGYHHFGGDEVFLPMRDDMLAEVFLRGKITYDELLYLLQTRLGVVIFDYHFNLNYATNTFGNPHNTFVLHTPFDRSENGFVNRETGVYVYYVYGHDLHEVFRPAVNDAGEFFYAAVLMRPADENNTYTLRITYENGETSTHAIPRTVYSRAHARGAASTMHRIDGVPVVCIRRMGNFMNPHTTHHEEAVRLLAYAEQLRDSDDPVMIIDLRSNEGGASAFPYAWLYRLLGEIVPGNFNWLGFFDSEIYVPHGTARPQRWYRGFTSPEGFSFQYPAELFDKYLHMEYIDEGILFTPPQARAQAAPVENSRQIIVLVDRFTLSSGEIFTSQFANIENTLVIGQNTFGMLQTSTGLPLYLPNSGLPVSMGRYMLVHPCGEWTEGVGFAPDVWAVGDALAAALALVR